MAKYLDQAGVEQLWNAVKQKITTSTNNMGDALDALIDKVDKKADGNTSEITKLKQQFATLLDNPDATINSFNEIVNFLSGISDTTLDALLRGIDTNITALNTKLQDGDDEVKALIVKLHAALNFSPSSSLVEKGAGTQVSFNHSATFDGKALTYTLSIPNVSSNVNSSVKATVNSTTTFTGQFNINNADPKLVTTINKTCTVTAVNPSYIGASTNATLTAAQVTALTKKLAQNVGSLNGTYNITAGQYMWVCVPSDTPNLTIKEAKSGGFTFPMEAPVTVSVNSVSYKCYRSSTAQQETKGYALTFS